MGKFPVKIICPQCERNKQYKFPLKTITVNSDLKTFECACGYETDNPNKDDVVVWFTPNNGVNADPEKAGENLGGERQA